jgi:DNA-binding NarL/FixJ family response regulator
LPTKIDDNYAQIMVVLQETVAHSYKQKTKRPALSQNMFRNPCKVLLIEDNPINVRLIDRLLSQSENSSLAEVISFELISAETMAQGLEKLAKEKFDVVLLDLMLPDSKGLDSLARVIEHSPEVPIVVQTASEDQSLVVKAFQLGAHGYLPKRNLDINLLVYGIRLALERKMHALRQREAKQEQDRQREMEWLEQLADSVKTGVTARMFGSEPLRKSVPDVFEELVGHYGKLMDLALEQQTFKIEHNLSEMLQTLAEKLGVFTAGPRDVIDIHTFALRQKTEDTTLIKAEAYVAEGRLMVLELMGYLTSFYRKYYMGLSNINIYPNLDNKKQ